MAITAIVENNTIRLPEGSHLPDGTRVVIEAASSHAEGNESRLGRKLKRFMGVANDVPSDLARNLDHYVHGQAKQL
jgi:hypothetical protein